MSGRHYLDSASPKPGLPSPAAAPRAPLCPLVLLTPLQGAAIPLQPGDRMVAAVGCPQGTAPFQRDTQERWQPQGQWVPILHPALLQLCGTGTGLVATVVSHYSVEGFSMGTVTKEHGMTATPTHLIAGAGSPHYKGFPYPKTSPKACAPTCPWLHVHRKQKLSFY